MHTDNKEGKRSSSGVYGGNRADILDIDLKQGATEKQLLSRISRLSAMYYTSWDIFETLLEGQVSSSYFFHSRSTIQITTKPMPRLPSTPRLRDRREIALPVDS